MRGFYRRHLPHGAPQDAPVFVTWNLKGALPKRVLNRIAQARDSAEREQIHGSGAEVEEVERKALLGFRISEEYLDRADGASHHLRDPRCADIVMQAILEGVEKWYDLFAFVVMSNHLHLLLTPKVDLNRITGGIKKKTAVEINALLNRTGQALWQDESFDHRPRNAEKFMKALNYIENNPVKAGLCKRPEDWPWSSASMRENWERGRPLSVELLKGQVGLRHEPTA